MNHEEWKNFCINQHDVVCNQKYDKILPYSQHLKYVEEQFEMFRHLISLTPSTREIDCFMGCWGHDLIEDARVTYNDIKELVGNDVADIIYICTEEKGKNRDERHSLNYYKAFKDNECAAFVKLCDIIANVKYSILTNSSMYKKHKKEHEKTKEYLGVHEKLKPMIEYLDRLFKV